MNLEVIDLTLESDSLELSDEEAEAEEEEEEEDESEDEIVIRVLVYEDFDDKTSDHDCESNDTSTPCAEIVQDNEIVSSQTDDHEKVTKYTDNVQITDQVQDNCSAAMDFLSLERNHDELQKTLGPESKNKQEEFDAENKREEFVAENKCEEFDAKDKQEFDAVNKCEEFDTENKQEEFDTENKQEEFDTENKQEEFDTENKQEEFDAEHKWEEFDAENKQEEFDAENKQEDFDAENKQEFDIENKQEFDTDNKQEEFDAKNKQEFDAKNKQEFDAKNKQEFDAKNKQEEFDAKNKQEFDAKNKQEFDAKNKQEFNAVNKCEEFDAKDKQEFDAKNKQEFDAKNKQEFNALNKCEEFNAVNKCEEFDAKDKQEEFDAKNKQEFDAKNKQEFDAKNKQEFNAVNKCEEFDAKDKQEEFDAKNKQEFNVKNKHEFDAVNKCEEFDAKDKQEEFEAKNKQEFDAKNKQEEFDVENKQEFDAVNKCEEFDATNIQEFDAKNTQEFDAKNKQEFDTVNKCEEFDAKDKQEFDAKNKQEFNAVNKCEVFDAKDKQETFDDENKQEEFDARGVKLETSTNDKLSRSIKNIKRNKSKTDSTDLFEHKTSSHAITSLRRSGEVFKKRKSVASQSDTDESRKRKSKLGIDRECLSENPKYVYACDCGFTALFPKDVQDHFKACALSPNFIHCSFRTNRFPYVVQHLDFQLLNDEGTGFDFGSRKDSLENVSKKKKRVRPKKDKIMTGLAPKSGEITKGKLVECPETALRKKRGRPKKDKIMTCLAQKSGEITKEKLVECPETALRKKRGRPKKDKLLKTTSANKNGEITTGKLFDCPKTALKKKIRRRPKHKPNEKRVESGEIETQAIGYVMYSSDQNPTLSESSVNKRKGPFTEDQENCFVKRQRECLSNERKDGENTEDICGSLSCCKIHGDVTLQKESVGVHMLDQTNSSVNLCHRCKQQEEPCYENILKKMTVECGVDNAFPSQVTLRSHGGDNAKGDESVERASIIALCENGKTQSEDQSDRDLCDLEGKRIKPSIQLQEVPSYLVASANQLTYSLNPKDGYQIDCSPSHQYPSRTSNATISGVEPSAMHPRDQDYTVVNQDYSVLDQDYNVVHQDYNVVHRDDNVVHQDDNVVHQDSSGVHQVYSAVDQDYSQDYNVVDQDLSGEDQDISAGHQDYSVVDQDFSAVHQDYNVEDQDFSGEDQDFSAVHQDYSVVDQDLSAGHQDYNVVDQNFFGVHQNFSAIHQDYRDQDFSAIYPNQQEIISNEIYCLPTYQTLSIEPCSDDFPYYYYFDSDGKLNDVVLDLTTNSVSYEPSLQSPYFGNSSVNMKPENSEDTDTPRENSCDQEYFQGGFIQHFPTTVHSHSTTCENLTDCETPVGLEDSVRNLVNANPSDRSKIQTLEQFYSTEFDKSSMIFTDPPNRKQHAHWSPDNQLTTCLTQPLAPATLFFQTTAGVPSLFEEVYEKQLQQQTNTFLTDVDSTASDSELDHCVEQHKCVPDVCAPNHQCSTSQAPTVLQASDSHGEATGSVQVKSLLTTSTKLGHCSSSESPVLSTVTSPSYRSNISKQISPEKVYKDSKANDVEVHVEPICKSTSEHMQSSLLDSDAYICAERENSHHDHFSLNSFSSTDELINQHHQDDDSVPDNCSVYENSNHEHFPLNSFSSDELISEHEAALLLTQLCEDSRTNMDMNSDISDDNLNLSIFDLSTEMGSSIGSLNDSLEQIQEQEHGSDFYKVENSAQLAEGFAGYQEEDETVLFVMADSVTSLFSDGKPGGLLTPPPNECEVVEVKSLQHPTNNVDKRTLHSGISVNHVILSSHDLKMKIGKISAQYSDGSPSPRCINETTKESPEDSACQPHCMINPDAPRVLTSAPRVLTSAPTVLTSAPTVLTSAPTVLTSAPRVLTSASTVLTSAPRDLTSAPTVLTSKVDAVPQLMSKWSSVVFCEKCSFTCVILENLFVHYLSCHRLEQMFLCPGCRSVFIYLDVYKKHVVECVEQ